MGVHPNSLKAIAPYRRKKGQPALNRSGRNGWTVLREKYRDRLAEDSERLVNVLIELAMNGDVQALRLALGPILDVRAVELSGSDGAPLNFADLARKACEIEEPDGDEASS
jgi:hypothetical protein